MKDTLITKKRLVALAAAVLLMPCFMTFAEDEDLQGQLSDVQSQMEQQQQKKGAAEVTIGSVSERLRAIQDALDTAMKEYKSITQEITATEKKIADTQKELDKAQKELESRQGVLSKRIRDIYMHGQLNYLDVVIGAKDFNDFANRVELLRRIIAADMDLISNIRDEQSRISEAKATLEKEHERQAQLQAQSAAKKDEIEKRKAEQQVLLAQAQNDKATAEAALAELQASSNAITAMLQQRAAARAAASSAGGGGGGAVSYQAVSGSGVFMWPVSGPITSPFGYRDHPIFGRQILHAGIDIGVDEGTPVAAADSCVHVISLFNSHL